MKLKTTESGEAVFDGELPVFILEDGTEKATDVAAMAKSLAKANEEAAKFRKRAKEAEAKVNLFGDLDPQTAKAAVAFKDAMGDDFDPEKAAHQVADLKSKLAGLTAQVEERDAKISTLEGTVDSLSYNVEIQGSEFVSTKLAPALRPPDRFRAAFGAHLDRDEQGRVIVKDAAGNTIMSEKNPGQPAALDEALPRVVTAPHDLAAGNPSGGGERTFKSGGEPMVGGKKFADLTASEQAKVIRKTMESGSDIDSLGFSPPS